MAGLFDIFISLHISHNCVGLGDFLPMRSLWCLSCGIWISLAFKPGHICHIYLTAIQYVPCTEFSGAIYYLFTCVSYALIFRDNSFLCDRNWSIFTERRWSLHSTWMKKSLRLVIRFREKKTMICLSQAKPFRKSHHFVYVVYMPRARVGDEKTVRNSDESCNTEESP